MKMKCSNIYGHLHLILFYQMCYVFHEHGQQKCQLCQRSPYVKWIKICRTYYESNATTSNNSCCTEVTVHNGKVHFGFAHLTATHTWREPFDLSVRWYTLMRFEFDHDLSTPSTIHTGYLREKNKILQILLNPLHSTSHLAYLHNW